MKLALYSNSHGSGKSTIARVLVEEYGYTLYTLASQLKELTHKELDKRGIKYNPLDKTTPIKGRYTLRDFYLNMGTRLVKERGPTWMMDEEVLTASDNIVIDDVRRPEEVAKLISLGFTLVFVDRGLPTPDTELEGLIKFDSLKHMYIPNMVPKSNLKGLVSILIGDEVLTPNGMLVLLSDIVDTTQVKYTAYNAEDYVDFSLRDIKTYKGLRIKHPDYGVVDLPIVRTPSQLNSIYMAVKLLNSMEELNVDTVARELSYQSSTLLQLEVDESTEDTDENDEA